MHTEQNFAALVCKHTLYTVEFIPNGKRSDMKLRVDDHLLFSLHVATQALEEIFSLILDEHKVTPEQLIILMCLWEGLDTTTQEIELRTKLPTSVVIDGLKNLMQSGYVFKGSQEWSISPSGRVLERRLEHKNREWQNDVSDEAFCERLRDNLRYLGVLLQAGIENPKAP